MYLLSKLIPLIFSPLGIIFILLSFFFIKKKQKYIYSALIFLLTFSNYFISHTLWTLLEYPLKRIDLFKHSLNTIITIAKFCAKNRNINFIIRSGL